MSHQDIVYTRTQDRVLEDVVRQSPVDKVQEAMHARLLRIATPWLLFSALPWVAGSLMHKRPRSN